MATGDITVSSFQASLPFILDSARVVRPYAAVMPKLVERHTLPEGTGVSWDEVSLAQLTAQNVNENTIMDNPQEIVDTLFSVTPIMAGIHTVMTRRSQRRVSKMVTAKIGVLGQQAMETKKDKDLLLILDTATTSLGGAGTTFAAGIIAAARARIRGNSTEAAEGEIFAVLHPYQIKDVQDDLVAGVGTYVVDAGITEETFRRGFQGAVFGVNVFEDPNITVDSSDDAKGGVFAREALVLVQGASPVAYTKFIENRGGGADAMWMYDEYAIGERSAGNWLFEVYTDAATPSN